MRWLAGCYAVALTYLLLAPEPLFFLGRTGAALDASISATVADWIEHGVAYALLAGLLIAASDSGRILLPACAAFVHGACGEVIQHWIPHRESSWIDLLADVIGISVATAACVAWRTAYRSRSTVQPRVPESHEALGSEGLAVVCGRSGR